MAGEIALLFQFLCQTAIVAEAVVGWDVLVCTCTLFEDIHPANTNAELLLGRRLRHDTLNQCRFNVGPPSPTSAQH